MGKGIGERSRRGAGQGDPGSGFPATVRTAHQFRAKPTSYEGVWGIVQFICMQYPIFTARKGQTNEWSTALFNALVGNVRRRKIHNDVSIQQ